MESELGPAKLHSFSVMSEPISGTDSEFAELDVRNLSCVCGTVYGLRF